MILYLSSSKFGNKIEMLKEWIKNHSNKIVLIANALDAKGEIKIKENIEEDTKFLTEIGFDVKVIDLISYFYKKEELKSDLKKYNNFCVSGGNVFVLRQAMKLSGFDDFLKDKLCNDECLYIGYSAGSCVLASDLTVLNLVDEPISFYANDTVIYEGIGLLDYLIIPHYKSNYHKACLIDEVVLKCEEKNINYKPLRDGEVLIINLKTE